MPVGKVPTDERGATVFEYGLIAALRGLGSDLNTMSGAVSGNPTKRWKAGIDPPPLTLRLTLTRP